MKVLFLTCAVLLLSVVSASQEVEKHCGVHPNLLRDNFGNLKWHTSEELQSMAVKVVPPEPVPLPGGAQYVGYVGARVMINTSGDVVCIWDAAGHPVMIPAAIRAIHEWKFKPVVSKGKRVEFVGRLRVPVSAAPDRK